MRHTAVDKVENRGRGVRYCLEYDFGRERGVVSEVWARVLITLYDINSIIMKSKFLFNVS